MSLLITIFFLNKISSYLICRFARLKAKDNDFDFHFSNLGNINKGTQEFNWENNIDSNVN